MKSVFLILSILVFSFCTKKVGVSQRPKEVIDTTMGNLTFVLNGNVANDFHIVGNKILNKIVVTGNKTKEIENQPIPFHYLTICLNNKSLKKQQLSKRDANDGENGYSDSSCAWSTFNTLDDDGDSGCESFVVNEGDTINNWAQITKQQNDFGEIWGNFSVSFNKTQDCSHRFYSNSLVVRNGYFHVFVK